MSASEFASVVKIGPPGAEIVMLGSGVVDPFRGDFVIHASNEQGEAKNILGETRTVLIRRIQGEWIVQATGVRQTVMEALYSLLGCRNQHLSFIYAKDWYVRSEEYLTTDTTHVEPLRTNPHLKLDKAYNDISGAAQVTITGVYKTRILLGTRADTNYYTAGSFDRSTWIITCGSTPGSAGTTVYVDYTYTGALAKIKGGAMNIAYKRRRHPVTGDLAWDVSFTLKAV